MNMKCHELLHGYQSGKQTPEQTIETVYDRIDTEGTNAWITVREKKAVLSDVTELQSPDEQPLYGLPFAVKDNIDCSGLPTTAGCPAYTYEPEESATVIQKLTNAGALLIGKTNMDQFATGLVGMRSPYGPCRNVYNSDYISGGSSSGSAVVTARGEVAFALGTDTAGSGRVPAAFNGIIGLKPTRGMVSTNGVVPACASLDCVSIFAHNCEDAVFIESAIAGYDPNDGYSRRLASSTDFTLFDSTYNCTVGIPSNDYLEFFGDDTAKRCYEELVNSLKTEFNHVTTIDFEPFVETAELLYDGPWVAERLEAIEDFVEHNADDMDPVVQEIISRGEQYSSVETFRAFHKLADIKQECNSAFEGIDVIVTPTTGTVYTLEEIQEQPIDRNSNLGYYTDYVNLLDLAAVAVPTGAYPDGPRLGVTILSEAGEDRLVASVGREIRTIAAEQMDQPVLPSISHGL